jgi:NADPH:quinone reductase-like Zn-dependent oxidoreductase
VIDYTKEDFTADGRRYDLILGVNGFTSLSRYKSVLTAGGRYVMAGGANRQIFQALLLGAFSKQTCSVSATLKKTDLEYLAELLDTGRIRSIIDRRYSLHEVPEAIRYVEAGHAAGKVVITVKKS